MVRDSVAVSTTACWKKGEAPGRGLVRTVVCLCLLLLVSGCTPKLYNIDMRYQPTKTITPALNDGRKYSLTVASFIDRRKMDDTLLIGRVFKSDGSSIPILPKYVKATDAVASALRELLIKSGYSVAPDKPAWNLEEAAIQPGWGTLLVGGAIDDLDVTCLDTIPRKRYTAKVRVTLIFADVQKKRIFYKVTSESSSSLDHVVFSEEKLESQINGVLSDAMEKAIEGPETGRQIREALKQ
ncbi:MAG: hypothetical protein KKF01_09115 [Proteobacteria bacterium]|nr:hypothetical protein [Pseudomonadota bacterium]